MTLNYPMKRRRLVSRAAGMVNSREFISINGGEPFGVRGELYRALVMMRELVHEIRDMQAALDKQEKQARTDVSS